MLTELLAVNPAPLIVTKPPAGPEVGETVSGEPKLSVNGLPKTGN